MIATESRSANWISPEEYLEGEKFSEIRHEYVAGAVYAMAGGSDDHNRISRNIVVELSNRLQGSRCEAFINDMKVRISPDSDLFYYPDVLVACDPSDNAKYFRERPSVIFEVISPQTERTDRHEKLLACRKIPGIKSYVLVEQDRMAATVFRPAGTGWEAEAIEGADAVLKLPEIKVEISVGRIYERTALMKA